MDNVYAAWAARWRVPLGFALGALFIILAQPTPGLLKAGGALVFLGVMLRSYAAGYLEKNQALATGGPYAYTRNPLYLGSFILGAGFALAGGSWTVGLAFVVFFALIYWPVMHREGYYLREQFRENYERFAEAVPLFFPFPRRAFRGEGQFSWKRYGRNREYQVAAGSAVGMAFLVLKMALR